MKDAIETRTLTVPLMAWRFKLLIVMLMYYCMEALMFVSATVDIVMANQG